MERQRLFGILEELVKENTTNEDVLEAVRVRFVGRGGEMPAVLDPFAGGGSIPPAQRLGPRPREDLNRWRWIIGR